MAGIIFKNRSKVKRNKPTKKQLRVDFTPMVDMNMLLITFFMFCTTLSIPQVMDIVVPTRDIVETGNEIPKDKTITLLLGEGNKVYYYFGLPDYENYVSLNETDFNENGLRNMLLGRNEKLVSQSVELRKKKLRKTISDADFKMQMSEIKKSSEGMIVLIKPTNNSSYMNLVDALDEMQICSIGKYAIVDVTDGDNFLIDNYTSKGGAFTAKL